MSGLRGRRHWRMTSRSVPSVEAGRALYLAVMTSVLVMNECTSQWYVYVPGLVTAICFVPEANFPVSKAPSSAVTEWLVPSSFSTVTAPACASRVFGAKSKSLMTIFVPVDEEDSPLPVSFGFAVVVVEPPSSLEDPQAGIARRRAPAAMMEA